MNENQKRTIHYSFKATPEEDVMIQKKMELAGIKNQSAFIRRIVLGGLILRLDLPELKNATRLMGNLSNNVNQIARRLHEGGSIYETEIDDIVERGGLQFADRRFVLHKNRRSHGDHNHHVRSR